MMKAQQGGRCDLLYTDTDSLLLDIETKNVYEEIAACRHLYDTSEFRKYRENKKVLRKMKDEDTGLSIAEYGASEWMFCVQRVTTSTCNTLTGCHFPPNEWKTVFRRQLNVRSTTCTSSLTKPLVGAPTHSRASARRA